jgi:hypothetical protein
MLKTLRACYPRYIYVLESKIFLPSCLHSGRAPVQTPNFLRAGRVIPCRAVCGGARAHVGVSRHRPCVYCTFVRPVFPTLHRAFVRVVHPWKPQISFGSCTHVNPKFCSGGSGRVVCGCSCKHVRASRVGSGRAMSCVGAQEHVAVQKMLGHDHPCASCTFARPVFPTLRRAFVRVGSCRAWMLGHTWQCQKC